MSAKNASETKIRLSVTPTDQKLQKSPAGSRDSSRKSSPVSRRGSSLSGDSDSDQTDAAKRKPRSSPRHVVSLNLNSKNSPLSIENVLEGIYPGGKPKMLSKDESNPSSSGEQRLASTESRESTPEKDKSIKRTTSPNNNTGGIQSLDEAFRQKVKKMDYSTVYMLAKRTKGPQQYKYRKILQEMYDEQNKS